MWSVIVCSYFLCKPCNRWQTQSVIGLRPHQLDTELIRFESSLGVPVTSSFQFKYVIAVSTICGFIRVLSLKLITPYYHNSHHFNFWLSRGNLLLTWWFLSLKGTYCEA